MCHSTAKAEKVAVTNTSGPFLQASVHRKRLIVSVNGAATDRVTISADSPAVLDKGYTLVANVEPQVIDAEVMGDWINRTLSAIATASVTVSVVDVQEIGPPQGAHMDGHVDRQYLHVPGNK